MSVGEQLALEGMALALSRDDTIPWQERFRRVVQQMPTGYTFTSETVVELIGLPSGEAAANRNNAVGAMMNALARAGYIHKTGNRTKSVRKELHAAEVNVWVRL